MRKLMVPIILLALIAGLIYCAASMGTSLILLPITTIALLALGEILILLQIACKTRWGVEGLAGVICIGSVVIAHILAEISVWYGPLVLLAGVLLLMIEAHVLSGHGIAALAGVGSIFTGTYYTLGGSESGLLYVIIVTLMTTALAFIALLAYISRSQTWQEMSRRIKVEFTDSDSHRIETSGEGKAAIQNLQESSDKIKRPASASNEITQETQQTLRGGTESDDD